MTENREAQEDELLALDSIFGPEVFVRVADGTHSPAAGEMRVSVELPQGFFVAAKDGNGFVYFGISSLPPLILRFELPKEYPSSAPPTFNINCSWLTNTQLCALDTHLADLYQATGGAVVLFSWLQFLKEDTLTVLDIKSLLVLPSHVNSPACLDQSGSSSNDQTPPVPNPGSERLEWAESLTEEEAGPTPSLINNVADDEEPTDGVGGAAQSHDEVDDDEEDTKRLSSETTHDCHASDQSTSTLGLAHSEDPTHGAAPDPGGCEQPCSLSSSSTPPPPPPPPHPPASEAGAAGTFPQQASSSRTLLSLILAHDEAQSQRRFAESVQDCGVCLEPTLGSRCMRFRECDHVHCQPCLAQYCSALIAEGNVRRVSCPRPQCKATPTPAQVRKLVGDDLFSRYERLLLQSTLDSMTDVVYCPRVSCASAVIVEPDSDVAQCSVCSFAFCVSCRKSYHGTGSCPVPRPPRDAQAGQSYIDVPQSLAGMMAIWDDYWKGSTQRKKLLEQRYGSRALKITLSEYLNDTWYLKNETKNCPNCTATIQKIGGCNHMYCAMCNEPFLWVPQS